MAETHRSCEGKKQLFLSYCHKNKEIVHRVADELIKLNYKIWIDRDLIQGNIFLADIQKGIENSHVIMCFISKNYCDSKNCMIEINFANTQNKKILPIMLDDYFKVEEEGLKLMLSRILSFYAFKEPETFSSRNHFEKLEKIIYQLLSEICPTCSKEVKNEKPGFHSMNSFVNDKNNHTGDKPAGKKSKGIFEGTYFLISLLKIEKFNLIIF
jgi:hypothetical protein